LSLGDSTVLSDSVFKQPIPIVIASEAKQSRIEPLSQVWIASSLRSSQ
jgi:hypothetical protein